MKPIFLSVPYLAVSLVVSLGSTMASADSDLEFRFQDMFVTSGYSAAAGAAIGAAVVTFQENPERHLNMISMGASAGFLGGLIWGGWRSFGPSGGHAYNPEAQGQGTSIAKYYIEPVLSFGAPKDLGLQASVIANF